MTHLQQVIFFEPMLPDSAGLQVTRLGMAEQRFATVLTEMAL